MIVGAWPPELAVDDVAGRAHYRARLAAWQQKALREAQAQNRLGGPERGYESATRQFLEAIFTGSSATSLLKEIAAFAHRIAPAGAVNGLAQALLKLTSPGVPDIYQGTEFWDLSLVDPDNRGDVDFKARMDALRSPTPVQDLAKRWRDGRIKQAGIQRSLALRQKFADLFAAGDYLPLTVEGPAADHAIAFARRRERVTAITITTRLATDLLGWEGEITIPAAAWGDTKCRLPASASSSYRSVLTGAELVAPDGCLPLRVALSELPVALMVGPAADANPQI